MLEAITAGFAQIVGLIINFKSEKRDSEQQTYEEFLLWLSNKKHVEIRNEIEKSQQLSFQIKSIIGMQHKELVSKLDVIEGMLINICANIGGFSQLSILLNPVRTLSEQAISILKQVEQQESDGFVEWSSVAGIGLQGRDKGYSIEFSEPRFIKDDLEKLCQFNFLKLGYTSQGNRIFYITRSASDFVKAMSL